jgi:hypothetical protein
MLLPRRRDHPRTRSARCAVVARDAHTRRVAADIGKPTGSGR